jgi:aminoglycoside 3-N-acetyltransferase
LRVPGRIQVRKIDITGSLRRLGLREGDCAVVHSSLSAFGHVEGSAETVILAFLEVLGASGTLVMPTFCRKEGSHRFETWDLRASPSDVGMITEKFRVRPGSIRSDHPTHSLAATGRLATWITSGHAEASGRPGPWGEAAMGKGSPWEKLYDLNARIVLLGVDFQVNSMVHLIEHMIVERALSKMAAETRAASLVNLHGWNRPGAWPSFDRLRLQVKLSRQGVISVETCGNAALTMVTAKKMVDRAIEMMEADPGDWFPEHVPVQEVPLDGLDVMTVHAHMEPDATLRFGRMRVAHPEAESAFERKRCAARHGEVLGSVEIGQETWHAVSRASDESHVLEAVSIER